MSLSSLFRRRLTLLSMGFGVVACHPSSEPGALSPAASSASAPASGEVHGIDLTGLDPAVPPGEDFFAYANGTWSKSTEVPPDRANWGVGAQLSERTLAQLRALLDGLLTSPPSPGSEARKVADCYASFMDEAAIEAKGITPLEPALARIGALTTKIELARELGQSLRADVDALNATDLHTDRLFGLWVSPGFDTPERNIPYLLQGGLGLPDRDYYLKDDARMLEVRTGYLAHVGKVLRLAGVADAEAQAARVLALETEIAKVHVSREDSGQVLKANNPWKRGDFAARAPGLDWATFFRAAGLEREGMIMVWQPSAFTGLSALVAARPLAEWQSWLRFHTIDRRARLLPQAFVEEDFAFYGHTLRGTPELDERWKRGVSVVNATLGDAVGKLFALHHFPPDSKAQLQAMVQAITDAFRARVEALDWMAPETKAKAIAKLATLYVGVGYPDRWIDYANLDVVRGDVVGNAERAEFGRYERSLGKLGKSVDKAEWWMPAQLVNALNIPLQNALNFPAAILVPPFFDPEAPAAANFGAIGAVIGHEISHSFDDQGAQFDASGKLVDWWTQADRQHFVSSGERLVKQYDAYTALEDLHVNGKLTLGENIADLAGLAASHDAWLASLAGQPAPVVHGLTGEQQFFIAFGQAWRGKRRQPALRQQLITDGHAPEQFRASTVRNLDAWYTAFDVKPGQALYLDPADRVRVW